MSIES